MLTCRRGQDTVELQTLYPWVCTYTHVQHAVGATVARTQSRLTDANLKTFTVMQTQNGPQAAIHPWLFSLLLLLLSPPASYLMFAGFPSILCRKSISTSICPCVWKSRVCIIFTASLRHRQPKAYRVSVSSMSPISWRPQVLTTIPSCWAFTLCSHFAPMTR